jgi:hypothetical protein
MASHGDDSCPAKFIPLILDAGPDRQKKCAGAGNRSTTNRVLTDNGGAEPKPRRKRACALRTRLSRRERTMNSMPSRQPAGRTVRAAMFVCPLLLCGVAVVEAKASFTTFQVSNDRTTVTAMIRMATRRASITTATATPTPSFGAQQAQSRRSMYRHQVLLELESTMRGT